MARLFILKLEHPQRLLIGNNIWYKKSPLGKNEVRKPLLKAAQNNSIRRTCISKVFDSDLPVIM